MRAIILVCAALALALAACHESVEYDLTCNTVHCTTADDTSTYTSGSDRAHTCVWHCAEYQGAQGVYVSLTFWSWGGGCWVLEDEYVSDGICGGAP